MRHRHHLWGARTKLLGLSVLATTRLHKRLHLPPEHLGREVLLVPELPAKLCQRLGLLVAPESAKRAPPLRRVR